MRLPRGEVPLTYLVVSHGDLLPVYSWRAYNLRVRMFHIHVDTTVDKTTV